jgi:hypothetical protein
MTRQPGLLWQAEMTPWETFVVRQLADARDRDDLNAFRRWLDDDRWVIQPPFVRVQADLMLPACYQKDSGRSERPLSTLRQDRIDPELRYSLKVLEISGHELEAAENGGGSELQIRIREGTALSFEVRLDLAEHSCRSHVIWEHRHGRKDPSLDVLEMPLPGGRPVRASEQLADRHRARELVLARHGAEPLDVGAVRSGPKQFRDRVGVEEVRHA